MTLHGYLKTQSSSAHHYIVHRFYANAKTNALDKENICVVAVVSMCRSRKIIYKRAVGGVSCRVVSYRVSTVLPHSLRTLVTPTSILPSDLHYPSNRQPTPQLFSAKSLLLRAGVL
jgi:hypothetical protein